MNLGIVGSRRFENYNLLRFFANIEIKKRNIINIVSGGAKGADSLAEKYADEYKINKIIHYADWDALGKKAGNIRNSDIVKDSNYILAFIDDKCIGTLDTIEKAKFAKKPVKIINYNDYKFDKNKTDEIVFYNIDHTYILDNEEYCTSVTRFIHKLFPEFDAIAVSNKVSEKTGKNALELRNSWKEINLESQIFGTNIHHYAESLLIGRIPRRPSGEKEKAYYKQVDIFISNLLKEFDIIDIEKIIFSKKYKLAGTVDLILKNKKTGLIHIDDWKTNKEIKYDNIFENAFEPISYIPNCNFYHYSLQLSLYKFLLLEENYYEASQLNNDSYIYHIQADRINKIKTADMNKELKLLIF